MPVYLLIDTSGSMKGEPIESVKVGLEAMLMTLRQDPYALETVWLSIITYDREARQLMPLTQVGDFRLPEITTPDSGPTHTGAALELLCAKVDEEVKRGSSRQKGDWMPLLFVMTDGKPSDVQLYDNMVLEVKRRNFASIVACAAGMHAKTVPLKKLTHRVFALETVDSTTFKQFFKWVSASIGIGNKSVGVAEEFLLPPPPEEVNIVV